MRIDEQYKTDMEFKKYVDAYARTHNITVETAMTHKIVKNVADQYRGKAEVRKNDRSGSVEVHRCGC